MQFKVTFKDKSSVSKTVSKKFQLETDESYLISFLENKINIEPTSDENKVWEWSLNATKSKFQDTTLCMPETSNPSSTSFNLSSPDAAFFAQTFCTAFITLVNADFELKNNIEFDDENIPETKKNKEIIINDPFECFKKQYDKAFSQNVISPENVTPPQSFALYSSPMPLWKQRLLFSGFFFIYLVGLSFMVLALGSVGVPGAVFLFTIFAKALVAMHIVNQIMVTSMLFSHLMLATGAFMQLTSFFGMDCVNANEPPVTRIKSYGKAVVSCIRPDNDEENSINLSIYEPINQAN